MSRMKPEVLAELLEQPIVGVLATLRQDGRPYTVPIWWLHEDGVFWLTGTTSRVWCKQLKRDARCSLCIETTDPAARHIEVDGLAYARELPDFDIWPVTRRLAHKFVPENSQADAFFENMKTEPRLLFRLEPQVWRAIDLTVYRGKRSDREHQERAREDAG